MRKKKTMFLAMLCLSFVFSVYSVIWAQPFEGCRLLSQAEELGLTSDQTEKLKQLNLGSQKAAIQLKADLKITRLELRDLLMQDAPDKMKIDRKIEKIEKIRTDLHKNKVNRLLATKQILTKEQLQKWQKIRKEKREMRPRLHERKMRLGRLEQPNGPPPPPLFEE